MKIPIHSVRIIRVRDLRDDFPDIYRFVTGYLGIRGDDECRMVLWTPLQLQEALFDVQIPVDNLEYHRRILMDKSMNCVTTLDNMKAFDDYVKSLPKGVMFAVTEIK